MPGIDLAGLLFYFWIAVGMYMLSNKDRVGWLFRFAGELGWVCTRVHYGMSSIWAWGLIFMVIDALGYRKWLNQEKQV